MPNGFGAGFFALSVLAVVVGVDILLALTTLGAFLAGRRGRIPIQIRYLAVVLLAAAVGVSAFGVAAFVDEIPVAALVLVLTVFGPLALLAVRLGRVDSPPVDLLATAAMAWSLPFLAGVAVLVGIVVGVDTLLELAPVEFRRLGIAWIASVGAGLAVSVGVLFAVDPVMRLLEIGR